MDALSVASSSESRQRRERSSATDSDSENIIAHSGETEARDFVQIGPTRNQEPHWYDTIRKFWAEQISVAAPIEKRRDHLGMSTSIRVCIVPSKKLTLDIALERTFLGYLRTSIALSMTGVLIAQLFRLQHAVNPDAELGYFVLGVPLSAIFMVSSMITVLLGGYRFWRQQNAMLRGKVWAGGWEILLIMGMIVAVSSLLNGLEMF